MPKNRVEELEVTVEELQATVVGLTEELVDVKERLQALEADAVDATANGTARERSEPGVNLDSDDIIVC